MKKEEIKQRIFELEKELKDLYKKYLIEKDIIENKISDVQRICKHESISRNYAPYESSTSCDDCKKEL